MRGERTRGWLPVATMALALALALAVRVALISRGWPSGFRYTLEFDSANAARTIYLVMTASHAGGWQQAWLDAHPGRFIEPPILQAITALTYLPGGVERPWTSMILTTTSWIGAAAFLLVALRRIAGLWGAVIGATYLLLAPFAIAVSVSFQVEALMMLGLGSVVWCASRGDVTEGRRFLLASFIGAGAGMVKPGVVLPLIWAIYGWSALEGRSPRDVGRLLRLALLLALTALPSAVYVLVVIPDQVGAKVLPQLLVTPGFYRGWAANVVRVVGLLPLIAAVAGFVLVPRLRLLGIFLAAGYLVCSVVLTWHTMTHDYYQVPLLMVVAIGLGGVAGEIARRVHQWRPATRLTAASAVVVAIGVTAVLTPAYLLGRTPGSFPMAQADAAIGSELGRGQHVIAYSPNYGLPLMYYGELIVTDWPEQSQLTYEATLGKPAEDDATRLAALVAATGAHYFVVTFPPSRNARLLSFLDRRYALVRADTTARIYDLSHPLLGAAAGSAIATAP